MEIEMGKARGGVDWIRSAVQKGTRMCLKMQ